jgi:zinc/manganese transport system permease protein
VTPSLSLDLVADVRELFAYQFMVNALEAATIVAVLGALVGWYVVLRRQSFAAHTLSVMAFPGAAGAALAGLPAALGYYVGCGLAAVAIGRSGGRAGGRAGGSGDAALSSQSAAIGTIQAVGLGIGFLLLSLNSGVLTGLETLLFGTFLGIGSGQVLTLLAVGVVAAATLLYAGRPLLFATVEPEVARSRGVPVAVLDVGFLLVIALTVAATSQITGTLLVFSLLVAPAAAAQALTPRPLAGLALSVGFALLIAWLGVGVAYFSIYPVGFFVTTFAFALYVIVRAAAFVRARGRR